MTIEEPRSDPDEEILARLPTSYAVALRLDAQGCSHELIAQAIAVDVSAVPHLLALAAAKRDASGAIE